MNIIHFFHFDSDPRFPPFLQYVRLKSGVTFVRRCFRDGFLPASSIVHVVDLYLYCRCIVLVVSAFVTVFVVIVTVLAVSVNVHVFWRFRTVTEISDTVQHVPNHVLPDC